MSSQPAPVPGQPYRRASGCEWCIYGVVRWFVCYSEMDSLREHEREICDRCLTEAREREAFGFLSIWAVEEA